MGFPVFYPVQGMDPRMNYNPYFNGMYPPPQAYPFPPQFPKNNGETVGVANPKTEHEKKL